ncbi:MAG: T9SS type A sorting domain-containing protein [Ignavibacteria bacterium]|nr:T9SS type A sorting domain-containing protein [Ignavibacteria bacterium]
MPRTIADGKMPVLIPYGDSINLYTPLYARLSAGTPFSISVIDENISDDSLRTTININVISPVQNGDYRLRINAVERYVRDTIPGYDTLYGTNGEKNFFDVFRAVYPDTNGISIPSAVGSYQYQYTYYKEPYWNDSMIYTTAFIQNDNNREVMNCAKGRNIVFKNIKVPSEVIYGKADPLNVTYDFGNNNSKYNFTNNSGDTIQTSLNVELFESYFPPLGWKVFNQDGFFTFQQYTGVNGPSIGGSRSVIMDFFDYNIIGQKDSMYSKVYRNLLDIDTVRFDYAYAQYTTVGTNIDSLIVNVSTDGGQTFPFEIFRKGGLGLSTAPQTTTFFIPQNSTQWQSFKSSLNNIVSVSSELSNIPSKFLLNQNYPNPFNPVTTISYNLPAGGFVKLKVFDILGKEIMTLVNENQVPGVHKAEFNASNLSSGIYFYRIVTDGFTDTKRMVLIK